LAVLQEALGSQLRHQEWCCHDGGELWG
jgi:hypothetical protein